MIIKENCCSTNPCYFTLKNCSWDLQTCSRVQAIIVWVITINFLRNVQEKYWDRWISSRDVRCSSQKSSTQWDSTVYPFPVRCRHRSVWSVCTGHYDALAQLLLTFETFKWQRKIIFITTVCKNDNRTCPTPNQSEPNTHTYTHMGIRLNKYIFSYIYSHTVLSVTSFFCFLLHMTHCLICRTSLFIPASL